MDPAVAFVADGELLLYAEEERFTRYKHAPGVYPSRALRWGLREVGVSLDEVEGVSVNWNLDAYTDGTMERFFHEIGRAWRVDEPTRSWQRSVLRRFNHGNQTAHHRAHWRRLFGDLDFPELVGVPHHFAHAFQATAHSPFDDAVCLTIDGSGDQHATVVWEKRGGTLRPIREHVMPHSLGWFYAAFTEYLGFDAYDGEYKVMGLAAYGRPRPELAAAVERVLHPAPDGVGYQVDPTYIHYGPHTYSMRFTDHLVTLFGRPPRLSSDPIEPWHRDVAHAVQATLEAAVVRLAVWAVEETGIPRLCIGGGVGHNVRLNSALFDIVQVDDIFANPLCSDAGACAGAALATCQATTGAEVRPLESLALGWTESDSSLVQLLERSKLCYRRPRDLCGVVAGELAMGRTVGWFQGRMEAGPRALGQRSILADPRRVEQRDVVNALVKHREEWRPFCPALPEDVADRYLSSYTYSPFMTVAFRATERLCREAPAIVHVDGTCRVQLVRERVHPQFHRLLSEFGERTGVPILLNTSFNVAGEPIVCTAEDALRTFASTGLDILVLGDLLIRKPHIEADAA